MIVVDTTVLAYAVGDVHPLRDPCRQIVTAVEQGTVEATTTVEVIQELAHVRSRRRPRADAAALARNFAALLAPLLTPGQADLSDGLELFERSLSLGAFDSVLAATAIARDADALVSADRAFSTIPGLRHLEPGSDELQALLAPR